MRNKKLLLGLLILLLSGLRAEAATFTVKAGGGGNFTTIQACAKAMAPGDTCVVYAGTYNELPTLTAGTVGNYKTITVNTGDTVQVESFVVASHTKLNGFLITWPSNPNAGPCVQIPAPATDIFITNNTMQYCGGGGVGSEMGMVVGTAANGADNTSFIYVSGNTFTHGCSAAGVNAVCSIFEVVGDHFLIENNDLSDSNDWIEFFAHYLIARNNKLHDGFTSHCSINGAPGSGGSSNCHGDIFESEPVTSFNLPSQHNMFEGNTVMNMVADGGPSGASMHGFLLQGDGCGSNCFHSIIRYNLFYNLDGYYALNDLPSWPSVKVYNNTLTGPLGPGDLCCNFAAQGSSGTPAQASMVNELWYKWPFGNDFGNPAFDSRDNLINPSANPFVNFGTDFHLVSGSAPVGTGTSLTTAANSGTASTSLTVADANFFQDGWGFPIGVGVGMVSPDWIRIGPSTTVQIASINYSSNTLTLANPVSWKSNDPVYLYKDSSGAIVLTGANPDIGAFPSGSLSQPVSNTLLPPTNLRAVAQ